MVRLARVNKDDVVLDTCTGSGGFLMESMEVMIKDAKDNKNTIKKIMEKQLIGFEIDHVLFALACSNMFLHGDGKTNLILGNSLLDLDDKNDKEIFNSIKKLKPTKIIINPPYENNSSIKFVDKAIDFLESNGKLIIIMPTPTLKSNQNGLTEKILEKAKLDFVIKMPNNLFSEQQRIVNTSIFGFTKTPHKKSDSVLFCNMLDDGLVSVQHKGRIDKYNKWNNIKNTILDVIDNNKELDQVSQKRNIYYEDTLNCYGILDDKKHLKMVKLGELFKQEKGSVQSEDAVDGEYNFITASEEWKKHNEYTHDCEAIIFAAESSGSLGRTHYVNGKFVAATVCFILTNKKNPKYPINLLFYNYYLSSLRKQIVNDLADGTSKLTIKKESLLEYYVDYFPIEEQNKFVEDYINSYLKLKKEYNDASNNLNYALQKIL